MRFRPEWLASPWSSVRSVVFVVALLFCTQDATAQGSWSALQTLPYVPVHASVLPSGTVLFVSYYADSLHPYIWDPATGTTTLTVPAPYELFCAGHTVMADGRVFITGGHIADYTGFTHAQIYDPQQNTFTATPDMNAGRWYPTDTVLPSGDVLVVTGDMTSNTSPNPLPQVYQVASNTWRNLSTAQLQMPLYPVMLVAPDGRVFNAGPSRQSRYLDTTGTGAWTLGPLMTFTGSRDYGPGLMYESGKILAVGGSDPPTATAEIIDLNADVPAWKATSPMHFARRQHNAVVLPDGKVLVVGGSSGSTFDNSEAPVAAAEMWDPATGTWTLMASIAKYRGYHSTAFLLPDGRVFSGGGNVGGPNYQLFSPPYLSTGARPVISSAPTAAGYGQTILISTPDAATISKVSLIRVPSVTHTVDQSGRFQTLKFTQGTGGVNVTFPANANVEPPGYYMLFLLNSAGVPSVASILQVAAGVAPATGVVTGSVTNSSGASLGGVVVSGGDATATTLSDGSYSLPNVTPGSVTMTAALTGYESASEVVTVTAGNNTAAAVLTLTPTAGGNVTGRVLSGGIALSGAKVTGAGLSTTTDATGSYTLSNVPAGAMTITGEATNFSTGTVTATVLEATVIAAPDLVLSSTVGAVAGTVKDSASAAIAGASVGFGGGSTTTSATGFYALSNLPAGTIQLVVSAAGFTSQTQSVVIAGGTTTTANLTMAPATGSVTGKVTNVSSSVAISGAKVSWSGGSTTTSAAGVFTLTNLGTGPQAITASATGYIARSLTATVIGGTSVTLNLPIATGAQINTAVKLASGAVVSGAAVKVTGGVVATTATGTTGSTGAFLTTWIPIGAYTVTVSKAGHTTQSKSITGKTGATSTVTFTNF
jgi:hypothetical protein